MRLVYQTYLNDPRPENMPIFNLLADDYRTYLEIELTKGKREVTEDDEREADALCKRHLERWREELE